MVPREKLLYFPPRSRTYPPWYVERERDPIMDEKKSPNSVTCPILDRTIASGCPEHPDQPATPNRVCIAFLRGDQLFEEGTPIEGVHCLHSGRAVLVKRSEMEERVVAVVPPGHVLGVPDILAGDHYQNGALALDDISVCFIPKEAALALFKQNPSIILRIMRKLCERITSIEEHMDDRDATETS